MSQATYVHGDQDRIDHTPGSAVAEGDVVEIGNRLAGIATQPIAASELGSLATSGIFDVVQVASTFQVGQPVYWDNDGDPVGGTAGSGGCTETAANGLFVGYALAATVVGNATVRVKLDFTPVAPS